LVLECFRPQGHNPDKPVVIVQHGMSRNPDSVHKVLQIGVNANS
jgi:hypothetical protein